MRLWVETTACGVDLLRKPISDHPMIKCIPELNVMTYLNAVTVFLASCKPTRVEHIMCLTQKKQISINQSINVKDPLGLPFM